MAAVRHSDPVAFLRSEIKMPGGALSLRRRRAIQTPTGEFAPLSPSPPPPQDLGLLIVVRRLSVLTASRNAADR